LALWLKSSFAAVALAVAGVCVLFSVFTFYFIQPEFTNYGSASLI